MVKSNASHSSSPQEEGKTLVKSGLVISFQELIEKAANPISMREVLDKLQQTTMGSLIARDPLKYDEALAVEFYESVPSGIPAETVEFTVRIKDKAIVVSPVTLSKYLKLSDKGSALKGLNFTSTVEEDWQLVRSAKASTEFPGYSKWGNRDLKEEYAILFDIITKTVEGRIGGHDRGSTDRWNLMMAIIKGVDINWSTFLYDRLLEEVRKGSQNRGYGIIINLFLKEHGLSLKKGVAITKSRRMGAANLRKSKSPGASLVPEVTNQLAKKSHKRLSDEKVQDTPWCAKKPRTNTKRGSRDTTSSSSSVQGGGTPIVNSTQLDSAVEAEVNEDELPISQTFRLELKSSSKKVTENKDVVPAPMDIDRVIEEVVSDIDGDEKVNRFKKWKVNKLMRWVEELANWNIMNKEEMWVREVTGCDDVLLLLSSAYNPDVLRTPVANQLVELTDVDATVVEVVSPDTTNQVDDHGIPASNLHVTTPHDVGLTADKQGPLDCLETTSPVMVEQSLGTPKLLPPLDDILNIVKTFDDEELHGGCIMKEELGDETYVSKLNKREATNVGGSTENVNVEESQIDDVNESTPPCNINIDMDSADVVVKFDAPQLGTLHCAEILATGAKEGREMVEVHTVLDGVDIGCSKFKEPLENQGSVWIVCCLCAIAEQFAAFSSAEIIAESTVMPGIGGITPENNKEKLVMHGCAVEVEDDSLIPCERDNALVVHPMQAELPVAREDVDVLRNHLTSVSRDLGEVLERICVLESNNKKLMELLGEKFKRDEDGMQCILNAIEVKVAEGIKRGLQPNN